MKKIAFYLIALLPIKVLAQQITDQPHLVRQGNATQLLVNDKPFLILGGELGNSSASDMNYMKDIWPKMNAMKVNTLLTPVYWELVEPREDHFDFSLVDNLISEARNHQLKLVFLWFGSWKNSMSCYTPEWIKTNTKKFSRAKSKDGTTQEILSPFYEENLLADLKAFRTLMRHIAEIDSKDQTVIMVQVENEIGMLPDARDYSDAANKAYMDNVPEQLIGYMKAQNDKLVPEFLEIWKINGLKTSGNWEQVFGKSLSTEELFMAWNYARYVEEIAAAGKEEYNIPMYVNAALIRDGYQPGQYPSAGPLPHLMDVWRAGAPSIDFLSPDIYFPNIKHWCTLYHRNGNPLFIPEARREPSAAVKAFYVIGKHDGIGFSPFSIETTQEPQEDEIGKSYDILAQLTPKILSHQGQGKIHGFILDHDHIEDSIELGGYILHIKHVYTLNWGPGAKDKEWPMTGGIIICTAPGEFIAGGTGFVITCEPSENKGRAGILKVEEGRFVDGEWIPGRRMNGDQDHQGRHIRIFEDLYSIRKFSLYTYQ